MNYLYGAQIIDIEPGWINLERHLSEYHRVGESYMLDLDSDELRHIHAARHATSTFAPGREHGHHYHS